MREWRTEKGDSAQGIEGNGTVGRARLRGGCHVFGDKDGRGKERLQKPFWPLPAVSLVSLPQLI